MQQPAQDRRRSVRPPSPPARRDTRGLPASDAVFDLLAGLYLSYTNAARDEW